MRRKNSNGIYESPGPVACGLFLLLLTLPTGRALAQAMTQGVLDVVYQKKITMPVAGAIAAYSLNLRCVEASANDGIVTVFGAGTCDTWIVVITNKGTKSLQVHVVLPPPSYPPGFMPPEETGEGRGVSRYEFRYISDPGEVQNTFDSIQRQGSFTTHMHVSGVAPFSPTGTESAWSFPYLFYDISSPRFGMTLFDQIMTNSPLTVDNTLVRGFHLRFGRWQFHAGYSSVLTFQNVLLPLQKEGVVGVGYSLPVSGHASLTANFYSIQAPTKDSAAQSGQIATLAYEYQPSENFDFLTEFGYSRGPAVAMRLLSSRVGDRWIGHFRYEPGRFANLGINNFHGTFGDLSWYHQLTDKFSSSLDLSEQHYNLPQLRQTNFVSGLQLEYRPVRQWMLSAGGSYSLFRPSSKNFPKINGLNFPVGIDFDSLHFGAGFQYAYTHNSPEDRGGQEFRGSVRGGGRGVYASAYFDRQTQTPTLGFILQQVPGLQQAMAELDLQATSPAEISQLFENNLTLQNLGLLNGLAINLSPVRTQWGTNLDWSGRSSGRQRLRLSLMDEHIETLESAVGTVIGTITYSRQLGFDNTLNVSFSAYRTSTAGLSSSIHPQAEVTFQHQFHSAFGLFMGGQRGVITGTVFQDKAGTSTPGPNSPPLTGVQVVLDGTRRAKTDSRGRYQFSRIPYGLHTVEVFFKSTRPFFYTTPSKVETEINSKIDFGVTFAMGRLFGVLRNDAGLGVANVRVIVASAQHRYDTTTGDDGQFSVAGMRNGSYQVSAVPDSLPPGYLLNGLKPAQVEIEAGTPAHIDLTLQAMRSISGRVRWFDPRNGMFVPVPGVTLRIGALGLESTTDPEGRYLFRQLPMGSWEIRLEVNGKDYVRTDSLGAAPEFLQNVDFDISLEETAESLSPEGKKAPPAAQPSQQQR
jgi:hypothetical protein